MISSDVQRQFKSVVTQQTKKKRPSPFPVRFSEAERAYLEKEAGTLSLGTYIRQELLAEFDGVKTRPRQRLHKPTVDQQKLAAVLAGLGHSQIPNNLNQLAKSANMGTLDISDDTDRQLQEAAQAVLAMREALFTALGLRIGNNGS